MLDKKEGVLTMKITLNFDPSSLSNLDANSTNTTNTTVSRVQIQLTEVVTRAMHCKLMYLYDTTLYVYCGVMNSYNLEAWPKVEETKLPYPNIEVHEIYELDDLVAFVGRNVFTLLYLNRIVNYY